MKDANREIRCPSSRENLSYLSYPTVFFALSDEVTLIQVSFFQPVYIVVDFPSQDVKSLDERSTEAFIFPNFLLSIAYDLKLSKADVINQKKQCQFY